MQGTKIILLEMVVVVLLLSSCTSASMHGVVAYDSFPKEISLKADSVPTQKVYDNVFVEHTLLSFRKIIIQEERQT